MRQAHPSRFTVTGGAPSDSTLRPDAHASEYRPPAVSERADRRRCGRCGRTIGRPTRLAAPERSIPATSLASHEPAILPEAPRAIGPLALDMPAASSVTPWGAAADGGVAVGEGSRKAAVATAGFFTRLSKSIGDSFDSGPRHSCAYISSTRVTSRSARPSSPHGGCTCSPPRHRPHYGAPAIVDETLDAFDPDTVSPGDVVGIGIHTSNALRGYTVGRLAREHVGRRSSSAASTRVSSRRKRTNTALPTRW